MQIIQKKIAKQMLHLHPMDLSSTEINLLQNVQTGEIKRLQKSLRYTGCQTAVNTIPLRDVASTIIKTSHLRNHSKEILKASSHIVMRAVEMFIVTVQRTLFQRKQV